MPLLNLCRSSLKRRGRIFSTGMCSGAAWTSFESEMRSDGYDASSLELKGQGAGWQPSTLRLYNLL